MVGHDTTSWATTHPTILPSEGHNTVGLPAGHAAVCAHGLARGSLDTKLYCGWGRPCGSRYNVRLGRWVVSTDRCDMTQGAPRYHAEGARHGALCSDTMRDTASQAWDTIGAGPAIQHPARHDTAQCARSLGTVRGTWAHHASS